MLEKTKLHFFSSSFNRTEFCSSSEHVVPLGSNHWLEETHLVKIVDFKKNQRRIAINRSRQKKRFF